MEINSIEKEIEGLLGKLKTELSTMGRGVDILQYAQRASERVVGSSEDLVASFECVRNQFELLEKRISAVDFSSYFQNVEHLLNDSTSAVSEVLQNTITSSKNLNDSTGRLEELRANIENQITQMHKQIEGFSNKLVNLEASIQEAGKHVIAVEDQWKDTRIGDRIDSLAMAQTQTTQEIQEKISLLEKEMSQLRHDFDDIGFYQKFKDIEHTMVKTAGLLETIEKRQDLILNQQLQLSQQITQQERTFSNALEGMQKSMNDLLTVTNSKFKYTFIALAVSIILGLSALWFTFKIQ